MFVLGTQWLILYAILLDNLTSVTIYTVFLGGGVQDCCSVRLQLCPPSPHQFIEIHNAESSRYIMLANLCVNTLPIEGPYGFEKSAYGFEKCEGCLDYLLKSKLPNVIRICKIGMHPFLWGSLNLWKQISITTGTVVFLVV